MNDVRRLIDAWGDRFLTRRLQSSIGAIMDMSAEFTTIESFLKLVAVELETQKAAGNQSPLIAEVEKTFKTLVDEILPALRAEYPKEFTLHDELHREIASLEATSSDLNRKIELARAARPSPLDRFIRHVQAGMFELYSPHFANIDIPFDVDQTICVLENLSIRVLTWWTCVSVANAITSSQAMTSADETAIQQAAQWVLEPAESLRSSLAAVESNFGDQKPDNAFSTLFRVIAATDPNSQANENAVIAAVHALLRCGFEQSDANIRGWLSEAHQLALDIREGRRLWKAAPGSVLASGDLSMAEWAMHSVSGAMSMDADEMEERLKSTVNGLDVRTALWWGCVAITNASMLARRSLSQAEQDSINAVAHWVVHPEATPLPTAGAVSGDDVASLLRYCLSIANNLPLVQVKLRETVLRHCRSAGSGSEKSIRHSLKLANEMKEGRRLWPQSEPPQTSCDEQIQSSLSAWAME